MPSNEIEPGPERPSRRGGGFVIAFIVLVASLEFAWGVADQWRNFWLSIASDVAAMLLLQSGAAARAVRLFPIRRPRGHPKCPTHERFPVEEFFERVDRSQHLIRIVETYTFLLNMGAFKERFVEALRAAIDRGVAVEILLTCPCSRAALARAREMEMPAAKFIEGIVANLRELFTLMCTLDASAPGTIVVKLIAAAPKGSGYQCDDRILMSMLPVSRPSEDSPFLDLREDSPFLGPWNDSFADRWRKGLRLEDHMLAQVTIHGDVDSRVPNMMFVEEAGAIYLAANDRDVVDALSRHNRITYRHGGKRPKVFISIPFVQPDGVVTNALLDGLIVEKYGSSNRFFFFRLCPPDGEGGGPKSLPPPSGETKLHRQAGVR